MGSVIWHCKYIKDRSPQPLNLTLLAKSSDAALLLSHRCKLLDRMARPYLCQQHHAAEHQPGLLYLEECQQICEARNTVTI